MALSCTRQLAHRLHAVLPLARDEHHPALPAWDYPPSRAAVSHGEPQPEAVGFHRDVGDLIQVDEALTQPE